MNEPNLLSSKKIVLTRLENGWLVSDAKYSHEYVGYAFESTESLARNLVKIIGKSGWKVEAPERDEKGHFKKTGQ